MTDIEKLRELNAAFLEGLITEQEYQELKKSFIRKATESETSKSSSEFFSPDQSNNTFVARNIPGGIQQTVVIQGEKKEKGCYRNTAAHVLVTILTFGMWLPIWLLICIFKVE